MKATLGILGASGFVGSALCERLYFEGARDFIPFVRSSGNAWRLARLGGLRVRTVDITDRAQARAAVKECTVLVNCALGDSVAALRGLRNVLDAAREVRLQKFIHLSSIAIYGQNPGPESVTEKGTPDPGENPYGRLKLRQDNLVMRLHASGVPCYILCPGNITGPYSFFARGLVERLASGPLPLVDAGRYPSNLIHVDNLVEAILAAVNAQDGAGERYFVNETSPVSWRQLCEDLSALLGRTFAFTDVSREEVLPWIAIKRKPATITGNVRTALSGEFRRALEILPMFATVNRAAVTAFKKMPFSIRSRVVERMQWPVRIVKVPSPSPRLDDRYVTVQVRRFYHSPSKIQTELAWNPPLSYERGLETLVAWLNFAGVASS
jgi:nucleoside-diphosphate-sugar epimerase